MDHGKIISIKEYENICSSDIELNNKYPKYYEGFVIKTDKKTFFLLISNNDCCCEIFGHISSEDDLNQFIGSTLRSVERTDCLLKNFSVKLIKNNITREDSIFLTLDTSKGTLQFTVYNRHNGYYGHEVIIGLGEETILDSI